jgi:hypothetical protein
MMRKVGQIWSVNGLNGVCPQCPDYPGVPIHASHPVSGGNIGLVFVRDDFDVLRDVGGAP